MYNEYEEKGLEEFLELVDGFIEDSVIKKIIKKVESESGTKKTTDMLLDEYNHYTLMYKMLNDPKYKKMAESAMADLHAGRYVADKEQVSPK